MSRLIRPLHNTLGSLMPVLLFIFGVLISGCSSQKAATGESDREEREAQHIMNQAEMSDAGIPFPAREFRAVWVASVANIDWPSEPGLPVIEQKKELLDILNRASAMNMNAVIFQVRPAADALYDSSYEPWSYFLTGKM